MRYCKIRVFIKFLIELAAAVPIHRYTWITLPRAVPQLRYIMLTPYLSDLQYFSNPIPPCGQPLIPDILQVPGCTHPCGHDRMNYYAYRV